MSLASTAATGRRCSRATAAAAAKANNPRLFGALSDEADVATTALNAKLDAYGLKTCGTAGLG